MNGTENYEYKIGDIIVLSSGYWDDYKVNFGAVVLKQFNSKSLFRDWVEYHQGSIPTFAEYLNVNKFISFTEILELHITEHDSCNKSKVWGRVI